MTATNLFHRLAKEFKEMKDGNPEELLHDFLLCMENAERGDFDQAESPKNL